VDGDRCDPLSGRRDLADLAILSGVLRKIVVADWRSESMRVYAFDPSETICTDVSRNVIMISEVKSCLNRR
jgi:hypothetical protein